VSGIGERLKHEREIRDASIDDIASATKIHRRYLAALERHEFETLPGAAYGKFYIRAYAEVLGFDPEPLIAEYDRERHRLEREASRKVRPGRPADAAEAPREPEEPGIHAEEPPAIEDGPIEAATQGPLDFEGQRPAEQEEAAPAPVEEAAGSEDPPEGEYRDVGPAVAEEKAVGFEPEAVSGPLRKPMVVALICLAGLIVGAWIYFAFVRGEAAPDEAIADPGPAQSAPHVDPVEHDVAPREAPLQEPPQDPPVEAQAEPARPEREVNEPVPPSRLTVTEYGVGKRLVNYRLEGRGEPIEEGDVALFQTRVRGGRVGERIRHVWIHEGKTVQSIELELGSSHWRTHSRKTLWQQGQWTVEARDGQGRVLAGETLTCVRPRRQPTHRPAPLLPTYPRTRQDRPARDDGTRRENPSPGRS
jgi:hypothetical protein